MRLTHQLARQMPSKRLLLPVFVAVVPAVQKILCLGTTAPNLMSNHFREVLRLLGIAAFESHEQPSQSTNTREWLERNPDMLTESRDELMRLKPSLKLTEVGRRIWPTVDEVIADASQDSALLIWACQALTIMKNGAMKAKMGQSMRTPAG